MLLSAGRGRAALEQRDNSTQPPSPAPHPFIQISETSFITCRGSENSKNNYDNKLLTPLMHFNSK